MIEAKIDEASSLLDPRLPELLENLAFSTESGRAQTQGGNLQPGAAQLSVLHRNLPKKSSCWTSTWSQEREAGHSSCRHLANSPIVSGHKPDQSRDESNIHIEHRAEDKGRGGSVRTLIAMATRHRQWFDS
ncbi:hypothetical protein OMD46_18905 [Pseudomonas sp. MDMC_285]|nr:hypothetical protein [Pseudomonas sp. MDMC_285]